MSLSVDVKYVYLISGRVRNFKQKNSYLWNFSCPICGDSQKNKSKARGFVYQKGGNLFYSCHNCGAGTNIANLLKHIDNNLYEEYIFERYKAGNVEHVASIQKVESVKLDKKQKQVFDHAEFCDKLPSVHLCIQYLIRRKIPVEHYSNLLFTDNYKKFMDALVPNHGKELLEDARLVIPFYDRYNDILAVTGRSLESGDSKLRYITIRTTDSEDKLIYGLERVNFNKTIRIVEGPIDSLFLDNCVASGDGNLMLAAKRMIELGANKDNLILISDNEPRNREICKLIDKSIKSDFKVVIWPDNIQQKDINDMILAGKPKRMLESIISNRTAKGAEAQLMFNFWKKV